MSEAVQYLLDTNVVSDLMSGRSRAARSRFEAVAPDAQASISIITHAEILFGLEKRPEASRMRASFADFAELVQILPWGLAEATAYARLRVWLRTTGKSLSMMDMLIAAQAIALNAILVTRDGAFQHAIPLLRTESWEADA